MTINKRPIRPHLIRQIPEQFSWVDHRLVRERYIDYICHGASALYLFLITVYPLFSTYLSMRGDRNKQAERKMIGEDKVAEGSKVIEIWQYKPKRIPQLMWRECIKKCGKKIHLSARMDESVQNQVKFGGKECILL